MTDSDATVPAGPTPTPTTPEVAPDGMPPGIALSWRAPLMAYGVTLGLALVLGVLALLALASGEGPAEVEDVSDATDGVLAWVAIPFQLTAMALGGRIGLGTDDFTISLLALPLLLTATYVVVLARAAAAAETRLPSRSRQDRILTSAAAAAGAAVVVGLLTRVIAMRSDGTTIHALSVSLVVGTLLLTFCADLLGREVRRSGLPVFVLTWSPAALSWLSGVALWLLVSLPVLFVLAWVDAGFRAALSAPLWWPTAALWTYALGHLSGIGTSGFYTYAWSDDGVLTPLVLLLGSVVATICTAVVWHLRSQRTAAQLATPGSWAPLPLTFAVGGVLVTLVPIVSVGGGALGVSGALTFMPAAWTCVLLGLWGLAAEALARTVAPQLARMLPGSVVARLAAPVSPGEPAYVPAADPVTPEQARRTRRIAILVGAGLAVVVAGAIAVSAIGSAFFTPEKAAQDYVDALAAGDVEALADRVPDDADLSPLLLTEEIYDAATDRPTGYTVGDVLALGDSATATVTADGGVGGESSLSLEKGGKKLGIFQEWIVTDGLTSTLSISADTDEVAVNGVTVPTPDGGYGSYAVLPGTYTVDPYPGNEWIAGSASEVAVALGDYTSPDFTSPEPSDAFKQAVDDEISGWLDDCMTSTEPEPADCPQTAYTYGDVRNLSWELTESPTVDYDFFDPAFPMDLYVTGGLATASYEVDESYGYGPRQWTRETEESSLDFSVEVDLVGDALEVTLDSY